MHDICEKGVLGRCIAHTYVVEFQKRGLPHAHILLILADAAKPRTPAQIDKAVCAELPDRTSQPDLWDLVTHHMFHGPCGTFKPDAPCMVEGECQKRYPKAFAPATEVREDSYPTYRRRDDGRSFERNGFRYDNRHVRQHRRRLPGRRQLQPRVLRPATYGLRPLPLWEAGVLRQCGKAACGRHATRATQAGGGQPGGHRAQARRRPVARLAAAHEELEAARRRLA